MKYQSITQKQRIKFYEVAPGVYAAITPYNGLCWANAAFVNRGKGLIFDTFFDLPHARELREFAIEKVGKVPAYVACSHYNCDHTWGNQVFPDSCIIMHKEAERERLAEKPEFWNDIVRNGAQGGVGKRWLNMNLKGFDLTDVHWQQPDMLVKDDTRIMLGDTVFELLNVAPSHSDSDLLGWLPREKVLFAGDVIFIGSTVYSEVGTQRMLKLLDFIIYDLKPEVIVPGHGALCGLDTVREIRSYFENLLEQFNKHYNDDISSIELAKKIDVSKFLHWIQPERIFLCVNPMVAERRKQSMVPDWDFNATSMAQVREYHEKVYGDTIKPWDPMCAWAE